MIRIPTAALVGSAALLAAILLAMVLLGGHTSAQSEAPRLRVQVLATLPHDDTMYTQGLEIADGVLYEGSGQVGQSRVRTSALPGASGSQGAGSPEAVLREVALPAPLFGEGLTVVGNRLWQLTWTNEVAIERDPATLVERRRIAYQGEGWGLCNDGSRLVMSDGSDQLTFRDPVTFAPTGQVAVRLDGDPVSRLNELDCSDGVVWANVYQTDRIMRIDPTTGTVTGVAEAPDLLEAEQQAGADVLNGIAAIPGTDEFLITGKYWPTMFRVRFVPAG